MSCLCVQKTPAKHCSRMVVPIIQTQQNQHFWKMTGVRSCGPFFKAKNDHSTVSQRNRITFTKCWKARCTWLTRSPKHPNIQNQPTNPPRVTSPLRSDGGIHYLFAFQIISKISSSGFLGKKKPRFSLLVWMPPGKCNLQKFMVSTMAIYSWVTARSHHLKLVAIASLRTKLLLP